MAINNYVRPHLEIHQQMQEEVPFSGDHKGACVVGANYQLHRYGQEELEPTTFSTNGAAIPFVFEQQPGYDYEVDLDSVSVNAEGLEASLATFNKTMKPDDTNILGIRLTNDMLLSATTETGIAKLDTTLAGLPVQIGDIVYVAAKDGDTPRRSTVTGLLGKKLDASVVPGLVSNEAIVPTKEGTYTGSKDTTYVVSIEALDKANSWDKATLRVTDTAGVDVATTVVVSGTAPTIALGTKGVSVALAAVGNNATLTVGDTFSVICYAAATSTTEFDGVVLSSMPTTLANRALTSLDKVEFRKEYSGAVPSNDTTGSAWTVDANGVVLNDAISLYVPERTGQYVPFVDGVGNVYVSFRALIIPMDKDEDVVLVASTADIQEHFGTIAPENEIAYGCACALKGSEGRPVYAIRTAGTDAEAFYAAVKKTEADDSVYSFAILTDDLEVMDRVVEFNLAMSQPEVMNWRRTLLGVDAPGEYRVAYQDANNRPINAEFAADSSGKNLVVQISESSEFSLKQVYINGEISEIRAGDKVQLLADGQKYTIASVLSEKELVLIDGPDTEITTATPVAFWKADTPKNAAEYVTALSKHYHNRRVVVVWCDHGVAEDAPKPTPNAFLAAEIAGLCSRVEPQQGITRFDILSIASAPRMYTQHTIASLDSIAKEGVMIVTQNVKNGPCYIRHQLTTETDKGLLYYEDSCTRNLDDISYALKNVLGKYIGKANVLNTALAAINLDARLVLNSFLTNATSALVGSSLVKWENLTIQQHPVFKDRVIINVTLHLPAPLNVVQVYELAIIADLSLAA